ncbi:unnamed protein product [Lathyrus oleraceus]
MASMRFFFLVLLIALSLSSIDKVQCGGNRKLLTLKFLNVGKIPGFEFPTLPPGTEWPEYRLPPPLFTFPPVTTATTTKP